MPDGYNSQVGERGAKLSTGQRQRIAIARALLKNPSILILDEATSNVDSQSEALIKEAFDRLVGKKTTIVIAHRLSTIVNSDQIIVLENGEIVETGGHFELLEKGECTQCSMMHKFTHGNNRLTNNNFRRLGIWLSTAAIT